MQNSEAYHSEEALIQGCIEGRRKAQRRLYELYANKMYAVSMRYSKTTLEADDILQESFIKIFDAIKDFKGDSSLDYWVKRIIINTALKHNRRKIDKAPKEEVSDLNYNTHENLTVSNYNFKQLLEFIQQLAPRYQTVFNLYAIEGYKHREIAEMLDISEGTSKSQYARAKALLQDMIAKEESRYEKIRHEL